MSKCAYNDCSINDPGVATHLCNVCNKPVHHICAIAVCDGSLSDIFCSKECAGVMEGKDEDNTKSAGKHVYLLVFLHGL